MRGAVDVREARLRHLLRYDRQGHAVRYQAGCRSLQGAKERHRVCRIVRELL